MAQQTLGQAQIAALAGNYKLTPATLMAEVDDGWIPAPFLQYLSSEIASTIVRGSSGLLVSAPPRHGKSRLITIATPLWVLENFPNKNVIVCTYGEDLSTDFTREVKDLIAANRDKLRVEIRRDVNRAQNFVTKEGGGLKAVGLRGTITGRGADVLIIDDYIKEPKEAMSHNYLESLWTWFQTVARTRLEPGAVVIIVATRWVPNDLHGRIERLEARRQKKFYKSIRIQAQAGKWDKEANEGKGAWVPGNHPDPLGRKPGEALFPQRYDAANLELVREELGQRWYEAMFQQNPQTDDSSVANSDNIRYLPRKTFFEFFHATQAAVWNSIGRWKIRRSWDMAGTKNAGDFTASPLTYYDTQDKIMYVVSMIHGQFSANKVEELFLLTNGRDPELAEWILEQEGGSSGKFTTNHFKGMLKGSGRKLRITKSSEGHSKLLKAQPFLAASERHQIVFVVPDVEDISSELWVPKFIDEFSNFPEGAHDDLVDALATAYNDASGKRPLGGAFGRDYKPQPEDINATPESSRSSVTFGRADAKKVLQRRAMMGMMSGSGVSRY